MKDSQVTVVANPYLVSIDGKANIDFVYSNQKKQKSTPNVPPEVV